MFFLVQDAHDSPARRGLGLALDIDTSVPPHSAPPFSSERLLLEDPFEGSPSTTTLSTFPSYTSTSNTSTSNTKPREHHALFGGKKRTASGRSYPYPKGDREDDREESERLWRQGSDSEPELEASPEEEHVSVRLVSSPSPRIE